MKTLRRFDLRRLPDGGWLAGVDEAGRGALAGPVVAAAIFVDRGWYEDRHFRRKWSAVNDSKQLAPPVRAEICGRLREECARGALHAASGVASVEEIEQHNILGATRLAMRRALEAACPADWELPQAEPGELFGPAPATVPGRLLVDGLPLRPFPFVHEGVVEGDAKSFAIALASILAKVTRDELMSELDPLFPRYGFREHKGYGTPAHRAVLQEHGPCSIHRARFLRRILGEETVYPAGEDADLEQAPLFKEEA